MADVIQTENSSAGILVGILIAAVIAVGAYFVIQGRDTGPDVSIQTPAGSASLNTNAR
jgi:hypothetical protein